MSQLYVRCRGGESLDTLRLRFPSAVVEPPSEFASIPYEVGARERPSDVVQLSQELGAELIFLPFQSVVDAFQFTHADPGGLKRHLQYGMYNGERVWDEVLGEAESWEDDAWMNGSFVVHPGRGDDWIMHVFETGVEPPAPLLRVEPVPGRDEPSVDAREAARTAAMYYRLTGWNEDWDEARGSGPGTS